MTADADGQLVLLQTHHGEALESFLSEFDGSREELHGYFCDRSWPIERCVDDLEQGRLGENIKLGWVPCTTLFWEQDGALQGVINVRHKLTPALEEFGGHIGYCVAPSHRKRGIATRMLAGALDLCRELGIERALLTADLESVASWKTIEKQGGVLSREEWCEDRKCAQRWYWIETGAV